MSTKHTEASWSFIGNSWQYTTVYSADGVPICRLDLEDWGVTEDNQSDLEVEQELVARLITAAPDLLEAARLAMEGVEIIDNLIASIQEHGNYSVESTIGFLNYARQHARLTSEAVAKAEA